jgi:hypothetical protein
MTLYQLAAINTSRTRLLASFQTGSALSEHYWGDFAIGKATKVNGDGCLARDDLSGTADKPDASIQNRGVRQAVIWNSGHSWIVISHYLVEKANSSRPGK